MYFPQFQLYKNFSTLPPNVHKQQNNPLYFYIIFIVIVISYLHYNNYLKYDSNVQVSSV